MYEYPDTNDRVNVEQAEAAQAREITTVIDGKIDEAALKAKYGKVYRIGLTFQPDDETELERVYYFKKPTTASYDRYLKTASNGMTRATRAFIEDSILEECKEQFEADVVKFPALPMNLAEKLLELLGFTKNTNLKVL